MWAYWFKDHMNMEDKMSQGICNIGIVTWLLYELLHLSHQVQIWMSLLVIWKLLRLHDCLVAYIKLLGLVQSTAGKCTTIPTVFAIQQRADQTMHSRSWQCLFPPAPDGNLVVRKDRKAFPPPVRTVQVLKIEVTNFSLGLLIQQCI